MDFLENLFTSPELYPLKVDFQRGMVVFVRMSQEAYDKCLFASFPAARRLGTDVYEARLDDVLLAAASAPRVERRTHYILHSAYCCSTLLARYFELLPSCFVLREPPLLAQLATTTNLPQRQWHEILRLSIKLLTRTFDSSDFVVIKTHVPCNVLGRDLLEHDGQTTLSFLMTPLRSFLLAVLKSEKRCYRVRQWSHDVSRVVQRYPVLSSVDLDSLDEARAAAYWWTATRFLCKELSMGPSRSRVTVLDGEQLTNSPRETLLPLMRACGVSMTMEELEQLVAHPSLQRHSKHPSQRYDVASHNREIESLEGHFGNQVSAAIDWISSLHSSDRSATL